jgi:hydrogenase maturation protein HypF
VPLLAAGGQLKQTFTLAHGRQAYTSQHIGDLDNPDTLEHFLETLRQYRMLYRVQPVAGVRDLHPDYLTSRFIDELKLSRVVVVQHHHAHAAAVLAEHGRTDQAVGVSFDGTGFGTDDAIWGSEFLLGDLVDYQRTGHLRYAPLPGGDRAARYPWRAALGYLSLDHGAEAAFRQAFVGVDPHELYLARQQVEHRLNSPLAASMGRLFDAAAAVLGVRTSCGYEGQAAMELESLAGRRAAGVLPLPVQGDTGQWILDPLPLLVALGERRAQGADVCDLAAAFHESVAAATADTAARIASFAQVSTVALGGGVFQNRRLLGAVRDRMVTRGLTVLTAQRLPPNDGGLSYGQAAVAAARLQREMGG